MLADDDIKNLLSKHMDIHYQALKESDEEWQRFKSSITFNADASQPARPESYLRVPFKEALNLVSKRSVFLHKGIAFVPINQLQSIASSHFRMKLSIELVKAYKYLPAILKDQRIQSMLLALSNHNAIDFNIYEVKAPADSDKINLADLDYHARLSFPPCMKALHQMLKQQHHLKHYGRLQYGLFLKGVGLTMEESLTYWKREMTKKHDIDSEKFEKNYAYNIRHSYGAEGKRNDYRPYNCAKVINLTQPGNGEYHGCPFKTFSEDNLV
jgi:DNA primase large subunit